MGKQRMVLRKIRNGRVRILGIDYVPRTPLLPEHEGQKALFGLYWTGPERITEYVSLWGQEVPDWPGIFCYAGEFKWQWWDAV